MKFNTYLAFSLVFAAVILTLSGCDKENIDITDGSMYQSEASDLDPHDVGDGTSNYRRPSPCPTPADYNCQGNGFTTTMNELVGTNFGRDQNGILDALVNCPPVAQEACNRECPNVTLEFGNHVNTAWVIGTKM